MFRPCLSNVFCIFSNSSVKKSPAVLQFCTIFFQGYDLLFKKPCVFPDFFYGFGKKTNQSFSCRCRKVFRSSDIFSDKAVCHIFSQRLFTFFKRGACAFSRRKPAVFYRKIQRFLFLQRIHKFFCYRFFWKYCRLRMMHRAAYRAFLPFFQRRCQDPRLAVLKYAFRFHAVGNRFFVCFPCQAVVRLCCVCKFSQFSEFNDTAVFYIQHPFEKVRNVFFHALCPGKSIRPVFKIFYIFFQSFHKPVVLFFHGADTELFLFEFCCAFFELFNIFQQLFSFGISILLLSDPVGFYSHHGSFLLFLPCFCG